jgi:hypothetical protein
MGLELSEATSRYVLGGIMSRNGGAGEFCEIRRLLVVVIAALVVPALVVAAPRMADG